MTGKKVLIIIIALALLIASLLLLLRRRTNQLEIANMANAPDGSFLVKVQMPVLSGRAPWEIPRAIFGDRDPLLRFGDQSPGAKIGSVSPNHLELSADGGWDLVIDSDSNGRILPGTRLVLPPRPGGPLRFNCRQTDPNFGYFKTTAVANSDKLDGAFLLRLPECKNAVSGKTTAGQPVYTVYGSFKGLTRTARMFE
jgi:hypothetical protein